MIETGPRPPYSIRQMGIYLVVDTEVGLVLLWDKGTSIFLRLSPEFKVMPRPRPGATGDGGAGRGETETPKQRQKDTSRGTQGETERQETGERDKARRRDGEELAAGSRRPSATSGSCSCWKKTTDRGPSSPRLHAESVKAPQGYGPPEDRGLLASSRLHGPRWAFTPNSAPPLLCTVFIPWTLVP